MKNLASILAVLWVIAAVFLVIIYIEADAPVLPSRIAFEGLQVAGKMANAGMEYLEEQYHQQSFEDVPPDYWAFDEIELIHSYGVTVGCSYDPPLYCPDRPMTRAEAAVFAARILELMGSGK